MRLFRVLALFFACGLLLACAHQGEPPRNAAPQPLRSAGYLPAMQYPVQPVRERWSRGEDSIDVLLLRPLSEQPAGLIVFLGGLGDAVDSPLPLLQKWAEAGHAVLSIQAARHGPAVLAGSRAREGDFRPLAIEAYANPSLQWRLDTLAWVMQELRSRQREKDPLAGLDLEQVMLVGFDLGAQTVQAALGEHFTDVTLPTFPLVWRAAIILSPYAGYGGESFNQRYVDMQGPMLLVTSAEDVDRFDYAFNARLREMPFRHMPGKDKLSLNLAYASHAVIGGGSAQSGPARAEFSGGAPSRSGGGGGRGGAEGGGRGGPGGGMGGSGGMGGPGGGASGGGPQGGAGPGGSNSAGQPQMGVDSQEDQAKSLQAVSLAFIDQWLQDDDLAREWLARDANRWLAESGRLLRR
ncbi:MAG: hypothetical protein CGU28_01435 [Candidatus Dactylopiibacterium carminicum]|nr:MAG: hypothetical protein CGU28_01435 [Candidatus Dactylopiibacterium carminicum]